MTDRPARAQLVLVGGTGGLAMQCLFPALARLAEAGEALACEIQVIAAGLGLECDEAFRQRLVQYIPRSARDGFAKIAPQIVRRSVDVRDHLSLAALASDLDRAGGGKPASRLYYLALPPELFEPVVTGLAQTRQLSCEGAPDVWRRLLTERPFGRDLESARALNGRLHEALREDEIFRVGGALPAETIRNLLDFRFRKSEFEPDWNRQHIDAVQITVAREDGVRIGQGMYFDRVGALREGVLNSLLPLLALVAMERPSSLDPNAIRDERAKVLSSLRLAPRHRAAASCVRAQYTAGNLGFASLPGYLAEDGVDPRSRTETYVAVRARIGSRRWRGVPFLLRYGMRLARRVTEVAVHLRSPSRRLGGDGVGPQIVRLQLEPRLTIFHSPVSGRGAQVAPVERDAGDRPRDDPADIRGALIVQALRGDATGFPRADEVEAGWRWVDSLRGSWTERGAPPLLEYRAGSWGPRAADRLFRGRGGGAWLD